MSSRAKAWDLVWEEDGKPRSWRLVPGDVISIGRARPSDIALADRKASRRHCVIRFGAEGLVVTDLGSRNGTFVRGERVTTAPLDVGERMLVGATLFSIRLEAGDARTGLTRKAALMVKAVAAAAIILVAFQIGLRLFPVLGRWFRGGGPARISVRTSPPAATVFLDGEYVGLTPLHLPNVSSGKHVLRLAKAGYLPRREAVELNSVGRELRYELEPEAP